MTRAQLRASLAEAIEAAVAGTILLPVEDARLLLARLPEPQRKLKDTPEAIRAREAKRAHREKLRTGAPIRKKRKFLTEEERRAARLETQRKSSRKYDERKRAERATASNPPVPRIPKPKAVKPEQVRVKRTRVVTDIAFTPSAAKLAPADKAALPDTEAWIRQNADKVIRLKPGECSVPRDAVTAKQRRTLLSLGECA